MPLFRFFHIGKSPDENKKTLKGKQDKPAANSSSGSILKMPGSSGVALSKSEGLLEKKFDAQQATLVEKREILFINEFMANKYWHLRTSNRGTLSEQELQNAAGSLSDSDQQSVHRKVNDDLLRLKAATQDPLLFKQYFFDELTPIMQENTDVLLRQSRFNPHDRETVAKETLQKWKSTEALTVKLLLSNINDTSTAYVGRWVANRVANATTQWGLNHAGLQIGPYIVDWTTSEIVIPRSFKAKRVVLLIPVNENTIVPNTDEVLFKISDYIVDWNKNYTYSRSNNSSKRQGNCHYFVDGLLNVLGITPSWKKDGPIAQYIARLKENSINGDSLKLWDFDGKEVVLNCHQDLVDFYNQKVKSISNQRVRKEMETILKSLERCMMFRFYATSEDMYRVERPLFNKQFKRKSMECGDDDPEEEEEEEEVMATSDLVMRLPM